MASLNTFSFKEETLSTLQKKEETNSLLLIKQKAGLSDMNSSHSS